MTYVRTTRSYEALTIPGEDSNDDLTVSSTPREVSAAQADTIRELAAREDVGVEVEFSDEPFAADTIGTSVNQLAPDLSRGISAMSGAGPAVYTNEPRDDAERKAAELEQAEADRDPYDGLLKADLEAEVTKRTDAGRTITVQGNGTVADLKAALNADDNNKE